MDGRSGDRGTGFLNGGLHGERDRCNEIVYRIRMRQTRPSEKGKRGRGVSAHGRDSATAAAGIRQQV